MRREALADADKEISRLIGLGMGPFAIAEAYGVPVRRLGHDGLLEADENYQALPSYLKGSPGVLTLGYLREALADKVEEIWRNEQEKDRAATHAASATVRALHSVRHQSRYPHGNLGDTGKRRAGLR